jgi:hypothetical protein
MALYTININIDHELVISVILKNRVIYAHRSWITWTEDSFILKDDQIKEIISTYNKYRCSYINTNSVHIASLIKDNFISLAAKETF